MRKFHGTDVIKYTNDYLLKKEFSLPDKLSVKSLDTKIYPVYTILIQTLMI